LASKSAAPFDPGFSGNPLCLCHARSIYRNAGGGKIKKRAKQAAPHFDLK
jgi:hypothetical protein